MFEYVVYVCIYVYVCARYIVSSSVCSHLCE